jgi:hypothetical protein
MLSFLQRAVAIDATPTQRNNGQTFGMILSHIFKRISTQSTTIDHHQQIWGDKRVEKTLKAREKL